MNIAVKSMRTLYVLLRSISKKLGFAIFANENLIISTPGDMPQVGDAVVVEKEGQVIGDFTGEEVVSGEAGTFKITIENGFITNVEKVEQGQQEQGQEQVSTEALEAQAIEKVAQTFSAVVNVKISELQKENEALKTEIKNINDKIDNLWKALNFKENKKVEKSKSSVFEKFKY